MTNIRLLPVVVLAIAALLVLKTLGLVTNGGYVLTGTSMAQASGAKAESAAGTTEADQTVTPAVEPTMEDVSPTLADDAPTLGAPVSAGGGGHGAPAGDTPKSIAASGIYCRDSDAKITESDEVVLLGARPEAQGAGGHAAPQVPEGSFAPPPPADCLPSGDVVPTELSDVGTVIPLIGVDGASVTEQQILERLAARRVELEQYESDLALRASIVDAAEKRIAERTATLEALEAQISSLVDQRTAMETGQFAGIVAMYENMRPKDAATIFDNLDMDVLLRVAKTMSPRKMAPILAQMSAPRAQELTVQMAALSDRPATEMTPDDLAALPQIVGQ